MESSDGVVPKEAGEVSEESDGSLEYSSCGGEESEYDKYCSANSAMGSASLCSSIGTMNDFLDLDYGNDRIMESLSSSGGISRIEFSDKDGNECEGSSFSLRRSRGKGLLRSLRSEEASASLLSVGKSDGMLGMSNSEKGMLSEGFERSKMQKVSCEEILECLALGNGRNGGCEEDSDDSLSSSGELSRIEHSGFESKDEDESGGSSLSVRRGRRGKGLLRSVRSEEASTFLLSVGMLGMSNGEKGLLTEGFEESSVNLMMQNGGCDENLECLVLGSVRNGGYEDDTDDSLRTLKGEMRLVTDDLQRSGVISGFCDEKMERLSRDQNDECAVNSSEVVTGDLGCSQELLYESGDPFDSGRMLSEVSECEHSDDGSMFEYDTDGGYTISAEERRNLQHLQESKTVNENPLMMNSTVAFGLDDWDKFMQETEEGTRFTDLCDQPRECQSNIFEERNESQIETTEDPLSMIEKSQGLEIVSHEVYEPSLIPATAVLEDLPTRYRKEQNLVPIKMGNLEQKELYDEFVLEMEEILLESRESHSAKFAESKNTSMPQLHKPVRDCSSTASTSGTDYVYSPVPHPVKIDGVEVVGARQKKGNVSFGERLVGVKEYTVYTLRVWSGTKEWEVEHRYRDFYTLYRQLKSLYADQGWTFPSPWLRVERESRKIFGNVSPLVVSERSALIQECIRSVLHSESLESSPSSLVLFLSPKVTFSSPPLLSTSVQQSDLAVKDVSTLGKKISLLVEIRPQKSVKQLLEAQHFTCAGCRKHLDYGKTLMRELVQTFGWGSTRLCEYTGQLFCAFCHTNETAVLPARVLHFWDFSEYPLSQMAKSYLDSIYDQPMLCVSAVNPFLFSKVPALLYVMGIRKKIGAVIPYLRCPFRRNILRSMGFRRYLLESNEFFALRDLVDLSKGAFSALPLMMETVSSKILEHVTQQCLVCCDVAVPCCARLACEDPPSLIFPFQESEIERCSSCQSVFHKKCYKNLTICGCGAKIEIGKKNARHKDNAKLKSKDLDLESSVGFLSNLFSKEKLQEKLWGSSSTNKNNVILMGSLPSNSC